MPEVELRDGPRPHSYSHHLGSRGVGPNQHPPQIFIHLHTDRGLLWCQAVLVLWAVSASPPF